MSQSGNTKICDVAEAGYVAMFGTTEPGIDGNGLFFRNSTVHIREITDGTSQTIAVGERAELLGEATWVGSVTGAYLAQDPNDNDGVGIFEQEARLDHGARPIGRRQKPRRSDAASPTCSSACIRAA